MHASNVSRTNPPIPSGSSGYRAKRITQRLHTAKINGQKLTMEDMVSIQTDYVSLDALDWVSLLFFRFVFVGIFGILF